jgi:hypothetical protein
MKKTLTLVVAALLLTAVAHANPPGVLANWGQSPQAYFMTAAEKAQWTSIATPGAAEEFVNNYVAKRGGSAWNAEVEKRTAMADKYLTFGKTKGSETIGGKMLILLGAPTSVAMADRKNAKKHYNSPMVNPNNSGGSGGGALEPAEDGGNSGTSTAPGVAFRDYTFTFSGKNVPGLDRDEFTTGVTVDLGNGKMTLKDKKQQADLDKVFESVAAASVKQQ